MTLRESIADDAVTVFLSTDEFAETVTYMPHRYFGEAARSDRSIAAVVERESATAVVGSDSEVLPVYTVHVANDSVTGISSDEIDTGGDFIEFPPRDGKDAERMTITRIVTQDHGMLVLECR